MNSKMIAIAAVAVLIASGAALVLAAPSDVEAADNSGTPESLGTVVLFEGENATVVLKFNETAYSMYDQYGFTIKAGITDPNNNGNYNVTVYEKDGTNNETGGTVDGFVVKAAGNTGEYYLTISDAGSATPGIHKIYLKLDVTVTPVSGLSIPLDPFYYELNIDYIKSTDLTIDGKDQYLTFNLNQIQSETISITSPSLTLNELDWYAIGLPAGLSIDVSDSNLTIFGMATAVQEKIPVKIVGRDSKGNEYIGTVYITVSGSDATEITVKLYDGESELKPEDNDAFDGTNYIVKTGTKDIQVRISGATSTDGITVSVIDHDTGERVSLEPVESTSYYYNVPTDGVGTYTIEVITNAATENVKNFVLHVVTEVTGSGPGFIVVGNP